MVRWIVVLLLAGGCKIAFDAVDDARVNGDGVIQRGCVASISAYGDQVCVRRTDNHVYCWGQGGTGQLGDGQMTNRGTPGPAMLTDAIALSSGEDVVCAIRADHSLVCWGEGTEGVIGDGGGVDRYVPAQVSLPVGSSVAEIALGQFHACARLDDGRGFCWGNNMFSALGIPGTTKELVPVAAPVGGAKRIGIGDDVTCIVQGDDSVACWGRNDSGQLGDGTPGGARYTPALVGGLTEPIVQVAGGCHQHVCAVGSGGGLFCWGWNVDGQVGTGATSAFETPAKRVLNLPPVRRVAVGSDHTCALTTANEVWCWGNSAFGQLGRGTITGSPQPAKVTSLMGTPVDVQASCSATTVLRDDGTVTAWGHSLQVGTGQLGDALSPVDVDIPCD